MVSLADDEDKFQPVSSRNYTLVWQRSKLRQIFLHHLFLKVLFCFVFTLTVLSHKKKFILTAVIIRVQTGFRQ